MHYFFYIDYHLVKQTVFCATTPANCCLTFELLICHSEQYPGQNTFFLEVKKKKRERENRYHIICKYDDGLDYFLQARICHTL